MRSLHAGLVAGAVLLATACAPLPADPPARPSRLLWIDVHNHLVGGRAGLGDYPGAAGAAIAAMDDAGIATMIVMPPPQIFGDPRPSDHDVFVSALKSHPGRFAFLGGGGSLNAMIQEAARETVIGERLRRSFEATAADIVRTGARGFGEITAHHLSHTTGHPYESVAADHPLLLLLADIAARHGVVIDFHFDVVAEDMKAPEWLASPPNPPMLRANLAGFERLLRHNRAARIVWAHAGSDMLGYWTVDLSRRLLEQHPNLYMSLRMAPGRAPQNHPLTRANEVRPEWLRLLHDFSDRFVLGGDQFVLAPSLRGSGPAVEFARRAGPIRQRTRAFLDALPPDLARKIAHENAVRLYRLKE